MELDFQLKDGSTRRAHLEQAERSTGRKLIVEPGVPAAVDHIWTWFWELNEARTEGFSGLEALTFGEIAAWADLMGTSPSPWEVKALKMMDRVFLASVAKIST